MTKIIEKNIKNKPRTIIVSAIIFVVLFGFTLLTNVFAFTRYGNENEPYYLNLGINPGDFPLTSVTVNGNPWNTNDDYEYRSSENEFHVIITTGMHGEDYPNVLYAGGLENIVSSHASIEGDVITFTIDIVNADFTTEANHNSFGIDLVAGPPIVNTSTENTNITLTISGDTLEYHYVEDKPDEADVTRVWFEINGGQVVPFTFGNADYTYNSNPAPNNVSSVTTKNPIPYTYDYDGSGTVTFHFHGAASDEYTKIQINGHNYASQAPHTASEIYEHIQGRATHFDITGVEYNANGYEIIIEGERLPAEKQVGSFGWNYKKESEPGYDPNEDSLFTHGSLEFVEVKYDGIAYTDVSSYNSARFHGTGEVFEWHDGNRNYQDIRDAWGEALVPYGAELTIRIVPDPGYQLVSLTNSQTGFEALDEIGVYKLVFNSENMSNGADNFHLGARFEQINNQVNTPATNVRAGNIEINPNNDSALDKGTAKLEVEDVASMSPTRVEGFESKADAEGYEIDSFLEMSLYNSVYKGGKKDGDNYLYWDTEVSNLANKATVMLELENGIDAQDVDIIHETHNGNEITGYELIDANYNSSTNVLSFETDGFSSYAIVTKGTNHTGDTEAVRVSFNTVGGNTIADVNIHRGDLVEKPQDPEKESFVFEGWYLDEAYHDEYDFNTPVTQNITLFAKWGEGSPKDKEYKVTDSGGNKITFKEKEGHTYTLNMIDYLSFTKEEVLQMGATEEEYNQVLDLVTKATKKHGELISLFEITVEDEDGHGISDGPFEIRIKMTDAMKKFNTFKMIYVKDDFTIENPIKLSKEGDYLVGTLKHLSMYTLVGSNESNVPKTGDNIVKYLLIFGISLIGLCGTIILKKKKMI